jgi:hypothetical protein
MQDTATMAYREDPPPAKYQCALQLGRLVHVFLFLSLSSFSLDKSLNYPSSYEFPEIICPQKIRISLTDGSKRVDSFKGRTTL